MMLILLCFLLIYANNTCNMKHFNQCVFHDMRFTRFSRSPVESASPNCPTVEIYCITIMRSLDFHTSNTCLIAEMAIVTVSWKYPTSSVSMALHIVEAEASTALCAFCQLALLSKEAAKNHFCFKYSAIFSNPHCMSWFIKSTMSLFLVGSYKNKYTNLVIEVTAPGWDLKNFHMGI